MSDLKLVHVDFKNRREAENELVEDVKKLIYSYEGRMSIASAFGCLRIVEHDLQKDLLG